MSDEQRPESSSVVDIFYDWYHVPVLAAFVAVMLVFRLQRFDAFTVDGAVYFSGNDAWYHLRQVNYTVRHWPFTMPFDPWTYFPFGTNAGQFGTIYDQLIATAALVVGFGSPSGDLIAKTLLVAPAVFGALTAVPVYLVGKRLSNRVGGLFSAAILMLLPGEFLQRGLVGFADHNVAEPFFQLFAVLALMVALSVAEREKPVWELVADRDLEAVRDPLTWSVVAGVAVALYMWAWPPGVLLVGVFGVYLVYQLSSDYVTGGSPEPVAFVGVVSMVVTTVLMLIPLDRLGFGATDFSLLQVVVPLLVAAGAAFMAFLARQWDEQNADRRFYPVAIVGLIAVGLGGLAVLLPSMFNTVAHNLLRTIGFSAGAETRTIAEAQPYLAPDTLQRLQLTRVNLIISDYGFTLFTGVLAAIWLLAKPLVRDGESRKLGYTVGSLLLVGLLYAVPGVFGSIAGAFGTVSEIVGLALVALVLLGAVVQVRYEAEKLLVIVWAAFIVSAAFTQVRFNYYLGPTVAVMNAYLIYSIVDYLDVSVPSFSAVTDLEGYQVLAIVAVMLLVIAPTLLVPMQIRDTGNAAADRSTPAWQAANQTSPGPVTQWDGSLQWLESNTPEPGTLGGANNELPYYGKYSKPGDGDYDYPQGAYGVMSWWDYGHWITVRGHRIPNANPFQQGAAEAANFLLAPNETQASEVLQRQSTEGNQTRYVMVDWQMTSPNSKFGAPIVWYDEGNVSQRDFFRPVYSSDLRANTMVKSQRYYESLMIRLYQYHGSAMQPQPIVADWEQRTVELRNGRTVTVRAAPQGNESMVKQMNNVSEARAYVQNDSTSQIGGVGPYPSERVPALEHYRLVKMSESSANASTQYQRANRRTFYTTGVPPTSQTLHSPAWVKTFERVPGATVTGGGVAPNSSVRATVEMRVPAQNETFTYQQTTMSDENGEWSMTLPYSTTGYDQYGPENGYTNVSVRATGPYYIESSLSVSNGSLVKFASNVTVSEGRVNGDVADPKEVQLEETSPFESMNVGNTSSQNASNSSALRPVPGAATGDRSQSDSGAAVSPDASVERMATDARPATPA
ncbi:oligosaccharyl transferase, archaeosortase A system-associated [Salinirarus marinus]|uniref:oligosaccharyl transferase, archaeosortase A system-associated n=1 Tax=Salinirarus marinus TaxID=3068310 RepID=UPI003C6C29A1